MFINFNPETQLVNDWIKETPSIREELEAVAWSYLGGSNDDIRGFAGHIKDFIKPAIDNVDGSLSNSLSLRALESVDFKQLASYIIDQIENR